MQRTGPRTGNQNRQSRLNKFKAFIQIFANSFDSQSDISKGFNVNSIIFDIFAGEISLKYSCQKFVSLDLFSI